ncbi:MAG: VWA domain-containing protein, partial [Methanomicrobiales archaeon]|nr:VWA domain-containing protein [Methanomicrobiales archaeon]
PGADIAISVDKAPWGVKDTVLKTDGTGTASTSFLPTTQSGTATITVSGSVQGVAFVPKPAILVQKIDAGMPYVARSSYPDVATVASSQNVSVRVIDRHGNPVTSLRLPNAVRFVTTASGPGGFLDGMGNLVKSVTIPLNDTGYSTTTYRLDTKAGDNYIMIVPPAPIAQSLITIRGIGNSQPFSIIQSVSPPGNPPYIMVDETSQATIDYYLYDEWGNPSTDQKIFITTSAGEDLTFITNQDGRASLTYGPKNTAGIYTIVATAVENRSVTVVQTLQFVSGDPKDMILTASPQTMASLDANQGMVGRVIAKVIDEKGNPVMGETVSFQMEKSESDPNHRTWEPEIEYDGIRTNETKFIIPVPTDVDGLAVLRFYPGKFPLPTEDNYDPNSQGTVMISAAWGGKKGDVVRTIELSYKNYPFLSVYTDVIPKTVQVGGNVDVSVLLKGDGWALQPKPIEVVLLTDRSGTMLFNSSVATGKYVEETPDHPTLNDRMVDAMNAAAGFVEKTSVNDQIGVVSFGSPVYGKAVLYDTGQVDPALVNFQAYRAGRDFKCSVGQACMDTLPFKDKTDDGIYVDAHYVGHTKKGKDYRVNGIEWPVYKECEILDVATSRQQIIDAIQSMVPAGGTNMRQALYESVKMILENPNKKDGSVKAIVLLSDGNWNQGGDPTGVDQSKYKATTYPEISIFKPDGTVIPGSVITWAKNNNIKIFTIALLGSDPADQPNVAQLQAYADETGGKPYVAASGLELGKIYEDIAGALREEASIDTNVAIDFSSVEVNGAAVAGPSAFTYVPLTHIVPPDPLKEQWRDDSAAFNAPQPLSFDAGTIKVNQVWQVNFTLKAVAEGNIKVLSSKTSKITFKGTVGSVDIPDTFITAIPVGTEKGPEGISFTIRFADPARKNPDTDLRIATMEWNINYNGRDENIEQDIWIAPVYSDIYEYKDTLQPVGRVTTSYTYNMVISDLEPGIHKVKVVGHVNDANDAWDIATINIPEPVANAQIKIE